MDIWTTTVKSTWDKYQNYVERVQKSNYVNTRKSGGLRHQQYAMRTERDVLTKKTPLKKSRTWWKDAPCYQYMMEHWILYRQTMEDQYTRNKENIQIWFACQWRLKLWKFKSSASHQQKHQHQHVEDVVYQRLGACVEITQTHTYTTYITAAVLLAT